MVDRTEDGRLSVDELFDLLRHPRRRRALRCLVRSDERVTVDELAGHLDEETSESRRLVAASLRHKHLPKLDDGGVVEYPPGTGGLRYDPEPVLEEWLQQAAPLEREE